MKTIELTACAAVEELSRQELSEISGGGFWEDIAYAAGYTAHVIVGLIADNIEHPIGAAGGYPPR
jgi:hypothetical protein